MGFGASKPDPDFPSIVPILVPRTLKGYPSPKPPQSKKCDVINSETFASIDAKCKAVTVTDQTSYNELVKALTKDLVSEVDKIRAIFTWLGRQQILQSLYPGVVDPTTPRGYMKLIKKQLGSYTEFFTLLCRAAGIPSVIIRGRCKSSEYEPGDSITPCMSTIWSTVYVDGQWRIVHPYWAFSGLTDHTETCIQFSNLDGRDGDAVNNNVQYRVDEFFFLPDPDDFRYFCWSEKPEWQLTGNPWTFDDFCEAPYFHSSYFSSGLKLVSQPRCALTTRSGMCTVTFEHEPNTLVKLGHILFAMQNSIAGNAGLDKYVCAEYGKQEVKLHVRLPANGVYKIVIYGGLNHVLHPLTEFRLECEEHGYYNIPFPIRSSIGLGPGPGQRAMGCGLHATSHLSGIVSLNSWTEVFEFDHACPKNVEAILRHHSLPYSALRTCVKKVMGQQYVQFHVDIKDVEEETEAEEFILQVYTRVSNKTSSSVNVLNYLLTSFPQHFGSTQVEPVTLDAVEEIQVLDSFKLSNNNIAESTEELNCNWNIKSLAWTENVERLDDNISDGMKTGNREELEKSFNELLYLGQDISCYKQELATLLELYEEEIMKKRSDNELATLMNLIVASNQSVVSEKLKDSTTVTTARDFLSKQHRVRQYNAVIQTLTRHTVTAIIDYRPNNITLDVMRAAFLVLGEEESPLQKWGNIQNLLLRAGNQSIVSRIGRFNVDTLSSKISQKVKDTLSQHTIKDVKDTSSGVAAFYLWALGVVKIS